MTFASRGKVSLDLRGMSGHFRRRRRDLAREMSNSLGRRYRIGTCHGREGETTMVIFDLYIAFGLHISLLQRNFVAFNCKICTQAGILGMHRQVRPKQLSTSAWALGRSSDEIQ